MALSEGELATIRRLSSRLAAERQQLLRLDHYYEGLWRLEKLGLAVPPELAQFVTIVNWPRIAADSVEQRCDVEGFRVADRERVADDESAVLGDPDAAGSLTDDLWGVWQANDLDELSMLGHLDAVVLRRAYACVGTREEDEPQPNAPLITVESPFDMIHERDPRTRRVSAVLRRPGGAGDEATLYGPDETVWISRKGREWVEDDRDRHELGWTPVEPLVNRPRLRHRRPGLDRSAPEGVSEIADVISLTDAACRALTNAQVATEVLAVPQRYALGASPKDFVDQATGQPLTAWEAYFGSVWAMANKDAKVGQFLAADLANFTRIVDHYANLVSGVSGLPTRFFGQYTTNPPSEGSIVADETRLIMNVRRKHRVWGASWERVMRLADRIIYGQWNPDLARLETLWANPETPTRAQLADAVVKIFQAGILPLEAAWEELGYSATRRKQLMRMMMRQQQSDPLTRAAAAFAGAESAVDLDATPAAA